MEQVFDKRNLSYEDWQNYKRSGIEGSDVSVIAGLNPYSSKLCLYFEKAGEINSSSQTYENSDAVYWSKLLEPIIVQEFCKETGYEVELNPFLFRNSEHNFMLANPKRFIAGEQEGLTIKTANVFHKDEWEDDNIPDMHMAQVQHDMAVTCCNGWYIAVLIGGNNFKYQYIERDDEYIDNLIKIESDFWFNNVQKKIMPDVDGSSASSNLIKRMFPKAVPQTRITLNGEAPLILNSYLEYAELESKYSGLKEECSNKLKMLLGDIEKGAVDNCYINWKNVNSNRFDSKSFQKDYPELFKQYSKDSSYRRFSIKSL